MIQGLVYYCGWIYLFSSLSVSESAFILGVYFSSSVSSSELLLGSELLISSSDSEIRVSIFCRSGFNKVSWVTSEHF